MLKINIFASNMDVVTFFDIRFAAIKLNPLFYTGLIQLIKHIALFNMKGLSCLDVTSGSQS